MKILITGANGMLAKEIKDRFSEKNELILTDVAELDITNEEMVKNFVKKEKPECIINCAAFTAVDKAETAGEIVEKINANGPGNLAKAAKENNAVLVHVSTDYVFGGDLDIEKDYKEAAVKNAGVGVAGAGVGVGVAVVTMGPAVAMGVATTFGVASTGTAISTLSGAAATNA